MLSRVSGNSSPGIGKKVLEQLLWSRLELKIYLLFQQALFSQRLMTLWVVHVVIVQEEILGWGGGVIADEVPFPPNGNPHPMPYVPHYNPNQDIIVGPVEQHLPTFNLEYDEDEENDREEGQWVLPQLNEQNLEDIEVEAAEFLESNELLGPLDLDLNIPILQKISRWRKTITVMSPCQLTQLRMSIHMVLWLAQHRLACWI